MTGGGPVPDLTTAGPVTGEHDYRILVTGSRDWTDHARLSFELGSAIGEALRGDHWHADIVIVHGACKTGADAMAARIAKDYRYRAEPHPACWRPGGAPDRSAGFRRNAEMVALGASLCLAFIAPCADLAERSGIPVRRLTSDD